MNALGNKRSAYPEPSEIIGENEDESIDKSEDTNEQHGPDTTGLIDAFKTISQFITGLNNPEAKQALSGLIDSIKGSFGSAKMPEQIADQGELPPPAPTGKPAGFNPFEAPTGKPGTTKSVKVL